MSHLDYSNGVVEAVLTPPPRPDDHRMTPEDVAGLVAFLASSQGDNITGQALDVAAGHGL